MSKGLLLQVLASVGAMFGITFLYVGLTQNSDALAAVGFGLFAGSLLVTPALRLLPSRVSDDKGANTNENDTARNVDVK